jgi:hypothetical protein
MPESIVKWKRVSSDQQDIRNQDTTLDSHVASHGYIEARDPFELPDTSAFKFRQAAALAEALADVKAGRYTRIIAVTSSRFLRSDERIGVGFLLELDAAGGRLEACDNPLFGDLSNAAAGTSRWRRSAVITSTPKSSAITCCAASRA